ncbi:hemerythrin domain-containing protein [Marivita hallyeonensis]|uniref:Hemerythrin HHE cation binding domain-containing protein n=1 Tax=Marivita hallyeonensis TaxID=996342 RepID=A0A1M5NMB2_9RHOB|nr:hemerythrin domain-containing protein [Marivita hallyeonensis]SHG90349.1 Hemerythrin HHE cation binding domain-containing protein [Marivita hallyeonensis]
MTDNLALEVRDGLPDALRVLLEDYPRETWETHDNFAGLVAFWLDRHLMFRKLLTALQDDAELAIDGKLDAQTHAAKLSRYGSTLLQNLHGHHQIEDHHYFPVLSAREPVLAKGFTLLDSDHHAMDGLLDRFAKGANAVIQGQSEPGPFRDELMGFEALLNRHLIDEEELIVPVILKHGPNGLS